MNRKQRLLKRCKSKIEKDLLNKLYPDLSESRAGELRAQYKMDYDGMPVTIADFAFPDMRIAIYCDGYIYHSNRNRFKEDRQQSRELQLRGWIVLRFAGGEIWNQNDLEMVVETIQRAIARRERQRRRYGWEDQQAQENYQAQPVPILQEAQEDYQGSQTYQTQQKPKGGLCGVIFLAGVIVGVLVLLDFIF